jgi:hypothetical protein
MGITQRKIHKSRRHILSYHKPKKTFPTILKTPGDNSPEQPDTDTVRSSAFRRLFDERPIWQAKGKTPNKNHTCCFPTFVAYATKVGQSGS